MDATTILTAAGTDDTEDALDWALTKLSLAAARKQETKRGMRDALEMLRDKIASPTAKNTFSLASMLIGPTTADEVIAALKKLDRTIDRLFFLRLWIIENDQRSDIGRVIQHALDLAIAETQYSPNASVYRDISAGLAGVKELAEFSGLVALFDGQRHLALKKGPTYDYVRFQLNVARAEMAVDYQKGADRLEELYLEVIYGIADPTVRGICLAWYLAGVVSSDHAKRLESDRQLHSVIRDELNKCVDSLLITTAEHYEVTKEIIEPLATSVPELAFSIARQLNIRSRRDAAFADIIEKLSNKPNLDARTVEDTLVKLKQIANRDARDRASVALILGIERNVQRVPELTGFADELEHAIESISSLPDKCKAWVAFYRFVRDNKNGKIARSADQIATKLKSCWEKITSPWQQISVAFDIASGLAKNARDLAGVYTDLADQVRAATHIETQKAANSIRCAMYLVVQSVRGLISCGGFSKVDFDVLDRLIYRIPCPAEQAIFWANIATTYQMKGLNNDVRRIVTEKVLPVLGEIATEDYANTKLVTAFAAPALWYAHKRTCIDRMDKLDTDDRDVAYYEICKYIFQKTLPGDPYESAPREHYAVSYLDLEDATEVLSLVHGDAVIHRIVSMIADAVVFQHNRHQLSREQAAIIASRTEAAIGNKLPDPNNIQHEGYLIVSRAAIARMRAEKSVKFWNELATQAEKIPNVADRALVFLMIASAMPTARRHEQIEYFDRSERYIKQMPSEHDQLGRYEMLAESVNEVDPAKARKLLRDAFQSITARDDNAITDRRRRLIDLAYRIAPDLPASLASLADDDPARGNVRNQVRRAKNFNEIRKMLSSEDVNVSARRKDSVDYANASWKLLGSLNAGRISPLKIEKVREVLQVAKEIPLHLSFPIIAFSYENVIKTYGGSESSAQYILKLFRAGVRMTDLAFAVLARSSAIQKKIRWSTARDIGNRQQLVGPGDRDNAIELFRDWLRTTNELPPVSRLPRGGDHAARFCSG